MPEHTAPTTPVTVTPSGFTPLEQVAGKAPARRSARWLLPFAGLALVALVIAFMFTARSLHIVVEAEAPAKVSVAGLALGLGQRYLLLPGDYAVNVSADGYQPLATSITVDQQENQTVQLTLQALPGLIAVDSTPPGATVSVDNKVVGKTPLHDLSLPQGSYQLLLQEPRHLPLTQTLQVTGRSVRQALQVELAPAWAMVTVDSLPAGASILLDGEVAGTTPATIEALQGEHQLILQLQSYANAQQTLRIVAGSDQDLGKIKLQPAPGELALRSDPSGANVTLDGEFQGQTPLTLPISPGGKHRLALSKPGYQRYDDTVEMTAASHDAKNVTLKAQLGEVRIRVSPANASVQINGKTIGKGNQTVSLPAVEHSVEISLDGYASVRRTVTPRPGLAQLVEVDLQKPQAQGAAQGVVPARTSAQLTTALGQTLLLFKPGESALANFTMGSSRRDPGRRANEVLRPVALHRMFYLQTTEVTNAQFRQFQRSHDSGKVDNNSLNQDQQPVVNVSWQQAAAFCNWLSAREKLPPFYRESNGVITGYDSKSTGYRLPSEAEWDWAARANGDKLMLFPWGETFPPTQVVENYADDSAAYITGRALDNYKDGYVVSAPVGSFKVNPHGLYDMGGNVSEWVHDVYTIPPANGAIEQDPLGAQTGDNFVIRGAAWSQSKLSELRLTYRDYGQAGRDDVGFRLARYAE